MDRVVLFASALAYVASAQTTDTASLAAWQDFFDVTNGNNWGYCSGRRETPCDCASRDGNALVQCENVDGTLFIKSIKLFRASMGGSEFPTASINGMIAAYPEFVSIDLRGNGNLGVSPTCIDIPACREGVNCQWPPAKGAVCTPFSNFFTATGGPGWALCNDKQNSPCTTRNGQPESAPVKIFCDGGEVTGVRLRANNLVGDTFPTEDVEQLISEGATEVDLTGNPLLAPDAECFNAPSCENEGVTCAFDKPVCADAPVTDSPSAPEPTDSPVATSPPSATTPPSSSPTGATGSPTLATLAPTAQQEETSSPTAPTTASPTAEGETLAPTASPTVAPTSAPVAETPEPTAEPSESSSPTLSPTFEGIRTHAPTESFAGRQAVSQALALMCAVFAVMSMF